MKRDNASKEKVESIISNQLSDDEKIKKSHFVIKNNKLEEAKAQALSIHQTLLEKSKK